MTTYFKNTSFLLRVFFVILAVGIIGILWQLNKKNLISVKTQGGTIHEGIIGTPRFINPVLAQSQADIDLTRLVFTPLLNINRNGELNYLLAKNIEISEDGLSYTLFLKTNRFFENGSLITADDVIFTIESIQDTLIKSPLATKWQGVEVSKIDQYTLIFTLARPFSDFLYNLEIGILPQHIWSNINPQEFIFSKYNTQPIGSGPYRVEDIKYKESGVPSNYSLSRSKTSIEKPYIEKIILNFFNNESDILKALKNGTIDAAYGMSPQTVKEIDEKERIHSATLPRVFALFFNQENQPLLKSSKIREAINYSIDTQSLVDTIFEGYASPINSAFGFSSNEILFDRNKAQELIESEGWKKNSEGWYTKIINNSEVSLGFSIAIPNIEEMKLVAEYIKNNLALSGINVSLRAYDQGNFNQDILRPREYESIIFGYEIEKPTDMYAFWHSTQISDPGLNISLFKDTNVDTLLSGLRNTQNPELQKIDEAIIEKYPAVFLYAPSYIYILPKNVQGSTFSIARSADRFNSINNWYMRTRTVWKFFTEKK